MSLSDDLRRKEEVLWERMVTHPFVRELGEGTLPREKFRRYFLQDYLFLKALSRLVALGIAKAPDFDAARRLGTFLQAILTGEEELFRRAFQELGISPQEYAAARPALVTRAFDSFLTAVAYGGTFEEVLACLWCTEGTYVDWSQRLARAGKRPADAFYQEWIDIHAGEELDSFVQWVKGALDASPVALAQRQRLEEVFSTALSYEYDFWEVAYHG